jgi:hypothetical protein
MENGPLIEVYLLKMVIFHGKLLNNQRVLYIYVYIVGYGSATIWIDMTDWIYTYEFLSFVG